MAIAPNGNPDKNGKKNGQKNSRKNGKKPGLKDPKVQGTVWVGDATACLTQACQWLKTQENNRYAVITPSPQAARSLGPKSSLRERTFTWRRSPTKIPVAVLPISLAGYPAMVRSLL